MSKLNIGRRKARKRKLSNKDGDSTTEKQACTIAPAHSAGNPGAPEAKSGVLLPTRDAAAQQLAIGLRAQEFVIIEGAVGSGKSFLAHFVAGELGLPVNVLQMGDQLDSKSLFGTYYGTEVAGQFKWSPSPLAEWLTMPCVILVEDLDLANADVVSALIGLCEERTYVMPSGRCVELNARATLVATLSGSGKRNSSIDGLPYRVALSPFTDAELIRLIKTSLPRISSIASSLCKVFRDVESLPMTSNARQLNTTDFLRGCGRVAQLFDLSDNMAIFAELVDCWGLADPEPRSSIICGRIAASLSISTEHATSHLKVRQPTFEVLDRVVRIGRSHLEKTSNFAMGPQHKLGHTKDVLQLMERIALAVQWKEPMLLVGETGVGKTSVVQAIANTVGKNLRVVNLSPTSDPDELIEGYKPTTIAQLLEPFTHFYDELFKNSFDAKKNAAFLGHVQTCLTTGRYMDYLTVVEVTAQKALDKKAADRLPKHLLPKWAEALVRSRRIREGLRKGASPFALQKGIVKEASERGDWLLIDEINLASPECLDAIIHSISNSHPDFRLFACMNPATDTGKRRLPTSVRTKFIECYVAETTEPFQIQLIISAYLPTLRPEVTQKITNFYLSSKGLFPGCYSLRTLCRALLFASDNLFGNMDRSLLEAIQMAFLSNLDSDDKAKMRSNISSAFPSSTTIKISVPEDGHHYTEVEGYWIRTGTELPRKDDAYVITKTVRENLSEISRIVCSGRFPVLLEGETSVGKTSIVCHLGAITGNKIIRINNHEHTDIQEYMGSYVADNSGRLVFSEGALVRAVKEGSWVILDELNLAPTDVIEALNRLLDDNRELFIPELNKVVKAHPSFRLFATQNPAGTYAGRKKLSRALLSRFVVLRFPHLPFDELSHMVCARCSVHPSAANKMIAVLTELRMRRSLSGLFSARDGLMTLRDVFRWGKRLSTDSQEDDWLQALANHGFFLLAGRCRNPKDSKTVVETLEKVLKRKIDDVSLFAADSKYFPKDLQTHDVVLTKGMRKMLVMTYQAWLRDEAVLVIGETGGGKTTLAEMISRGNMLTLNCHERTETADLLGRLRPRESGGFEWCDGVVVSAMKQGAALLVDEISLAEDSVLERLNPLFEENRSLLLSDAGVETTSIAAAPGFQLIATMNPGGDYGKKELSKALRNRFTEVWTSCEFETDELAEICELRLRKQVRIGADDRHFVSTALITWIANFYEKFSHVFRHLPSVRDLVACTDLYAAAVNHGLGRNLAIIGAIHCCFLDGLSTLPTRFAVDSDEIKRIGNEMIAAILSTDVTTISEPVSVKIAPTQLEIGPLAVPFGRLDSRPPPNFSFNAPTCVSNLYRVARGLLIRKPILLEGPPGSGKSSSVMALAQVTGHPITRVNLSEQTDLSELFGCDVPVFLDDGVVSFKWQDGPVLRAIKAGEWVLLDEMNLASQSVLEGLNACFDHRGVVYIPEINKTFQIPSGSDVRFFACQNPQAQGGNRRALPKSFINRFTTIWVDDLTANDIFLILRENELAAGIDEGTLRSMISVNEEMGRAAFRGGPFTFNLRDLLRWIEAYCATHNAASTFMTLYSARLRNSGDRETASEIFAKFFDVRPCLVPAMISCDESALLIGDRQVSKTATTDGTNAANTLSLLPTQKVLLYQLAACVKFGWLSLLVGPRNSGKRSAITTLATLTGATLKTISLNAETDAQELIGSYEQILDNTHLTKAKEALLALFKSKLDDKNRRAVQAADSLVSLETAVELALASLENDVTLSEQCHSILKAAASSDMRFAWVDSQFVRAFLEGHWLLVEDVNLCSGAVLDRLNSCLEAGGTLVVAERGDFVPLRPHPNFRIFFAMDTLNGEVSRAMRNRSVEIFVEQDWASDICDSLAVLRSMADRSFEVPTKLIYSLSTLESQQLLRLGVLLKEIGFEDALRHLGVPVEDLEPYIGPLSVPISVSAAMSTSGLMKWTCDQWDLAGQGEPHLYMLLMALAGSKMTLVSMASEGSLLGRQLYTRLAAQLEDLKTTNNPIDGRFNGVLRSENRKMVFAITLLKEWCLRLVDSEFLHENSAEALSTTLTKYELSNHELTFNGLHQIAPLLQAVCHYLKSDKMPDEEDEEKIVAFLLHLLAFSVEARKELSMRFGSAPLYIAWSAMQSASFNSSVELKQNFLAMSSVWSRESHEAFVREYLVAYEAARPVDGFETQASSEEFVNQLSTTVAEMEMEMPESPLAFVEKLLQRTIKIAHFIRANGCQQFDEIANEYSDLKALSHLNWRGEVPRRIARIAALCNQSYFGDTAVVELANLSPFFEINNALWAALGYDATMSELKVRDLKMFSLDEMRDNFWRLAANSGAIQRSIGSELQRMLDGFEGWTSGGEVLEVDWTGRLAAGLTLMKKACPPPETMDPIVFEEASEKYLLDSLNVVEGQLDCLARFRRLTTAQSPECDANSPHPFIGYLWRRRQALRDEIDGRRTSQRYCIYRQNAAEYARMIAELQSFILLTAETAERARSNAEADLGEMKLLQQQLISFSMSARSMINGLLRRYPTFVDVSLTFIIGLYIVRTAVLESIASLDKQIEKQSLVTSHSIPPKITVVQTAEGFRLPELETWAVRERSPLPLGLKAALIAENLAQERDTLVSLEWIRQEWKKWFEQNVQKAKDKEFYYREKPQEERDDDERNEFFDGVFDKDSQILNVDQMCELLCEVSNNTDISHEKTAKERRCVARIWLSRMAASVGQLPLDVQYQATELQLALLKNIITKSPQNGPLDVYRRSCTLEIHKALKYLDGLRKRTVEVQERWPEVVSLKRILEAIDTFEDESLSATHMKLSIRLEELLGACEEWVKLADRANSIRDQMMPLKELLLEWKKLEVRCWSILLSRTIDDSETRTYLVSWPLFESLFSADGTKNLVPQAIEWLHHGSLMDFAVRIQTVRDLARWAEKLGHANLAIQLSSAAAHFAQFLPIVRSRLAEAHKPAEQSLKDYVHIAKYNDLNLDNIKASSKKAHAQIFKIIKKFRETTNEGVAPLLEKLIDVDDLMRQTIRIPEAASSEELRGRLRTAEDLVQKALGKVEGECAEEPFVELAEQIQACDELVRKRVDYVGEDAEKEKLQGYERNRRQRAVAMVIKQAQTIGLNARRAVVIDKEALSKKSVTGLKHDVKTLPCESLVRAAAAGRSNITRRALTPNDQLGVSTCGHFTGMVEYGLHWQIEAETREETWAEQLLALRNLKGLLQVAAKNTKDGYFPSYTLLNERLPILQDCADRVYFALERCLRRLVDVPNGPSSDDYPHLHPLSRLYRGQPELEKLEQATRHALQIATDVKMAFMDLKRAGRGIDDDCKLYERSAIEVAFTRVDQSIDTLHEALNEIQPYFEAEVLQMTASLSALKNSVEIPQISWQDVEYSQEPLLLYIQCVYKKCQEEERFTESQKPLEKYDVLLKIVDDCGVAKVISHLSSMARGLSIGQIPSDLEETARLTALCFDLFFSLVSRSLRQLHTFSGCYHRLLSLAEQLFKEGYVNLIPKPEKTEGGDGQDIEGGEGGGMGEGKGSDNAKDVTDEMEETGQIEGLQGDEPEDNPEGPSTKNDTPIEMEEDFPEDIRDIDREEKDTNEEGNDEEDDEKEPQIDDEMGQVDEAEEDQLDPKLWDDDEKENREKELDQNNQAADRDTDQLAANDDQRDREIEPEEGKEEDDSQKDDGLENVDERDADQQNDENDAPEDAQTQQNEAEDDDADNEEGQELPDGKVDENDDVDEDAEEDETHDTDSPSDAAEQEENGEPEEDMDETTGQDENQEPDASEPEKKPADAQGHGGEKAEDLEQTDAGGRNSEQEEQNMEQDEGEGHTKRDRVGDVGTGANDEQEDAGHEDEEKEGEEESAQQADQILRELATDDEVVMMETEEMAGEQDEKGELAEKSEQDCNKQMLGHGTTEEARQSKKDAADLPKAKRKHPLLGIDHPDTEDIGDEGGLLAELPATVHLAPDDLYALAEDITKQMVLGRAAEGSTDNDESQPSDDRSHSDVSALWTDISRSVEVLSAELAENLRLILEPQRATKLQGDYRSGKRLNMRRLIPYIASDYRKDRIWMRRTKRSQREYQVLIAVDDSGSMDEFGMGRVTCESVCVVDEALRKVDAGHVQVVSFGETVRELRNWTDSQQPGYALLSALHFDQKKTDLTEMLRWTANSLDVARTSNSEQLLIIISDGRGALHQGAEKVKEALRRFAGVTVLFVVLDTAKKSIEEMTVASFANNKVQLTPYLSLFPFPFYAVIKSVAQLPSVLSESIRQWFEMCVQHNQ